MYTSNFITQEQSQVDLILARTEANFLLTWEKVISRTSYVLRIGSIGFELGIMFYLLESLAGLFCVDLQENFHKELEIGSVEFETLFGLL